MGYKSKSYAAKVAAKMAAKDGKARRVHQWPDGTYQVAYVD